MKALRVESRLWMTVAAAVLSGCIEMIPPPDAGSDAGPEVDAGRSDSGVVVDSGVDAGVDAGRPDSGVDAGVGDAGQPDSGVDAGALDSGVVDGGATDAGIDSGVVDAGIDAGVPDAGPMAACVTGGQCASGRCLATGDCFNCRSDAECGFGRVCGTGVCEPSCTTSLSCSPGKECCGGRCVDVQADVLHCGACTVACDRESFCGRGQCRVTDFSQLCQLPVATVMLDGIAGDDDAGQSMAAALVSACSPTVTSRVVGQGDAGVLRASDGEPLQLGEVLVMGGGSFRQRGIRWLEQTGNAELNDTSSGPNYVLTLRDGGVALNVAATSVTPTDDRILVQLVRTPSGAVVLNAAGFHGPGTLAAAEYFVGTVLPNRASLTTRWYVLQWLDVDSSGGPSSGDIYTVIASGP